MIFGSLQCNNLHLETLVLSQQRYMLSRGYVITYQKLARYKTYEKDLCMY